MQLGTASAHKRHEFTRTVVGYARIKGPIGPVLRSHFRTSAAVRLGFSVPVELTTVGQIKNSPFNVAVFKPIGQLDTIKDTTE